MVKFKNYELSYIDHLSRLFFLNSKQKSIIISSFNNDNKLEIIDEFNLGNVFHSISSIYVTSEDYLVDSVDSVFKSLIKVIKLNFKLKFYN